MILKIADWRFRVDVEATGERTEKYSTDHCTCPYCRNFYDTVESTYPKLKAFLDHFGIHMSGPCELMPFEPTLMLACYRVDGQVLQWGREELHADGINVTVEAGDDATFLLWVGEAELPWVQPEPMEDVVSPAKLPEVMERMLDVWQIRHGTEFVFS